MTYEKPPFSPRSSGANASRYNPKYERPRSHSAETGKRDYGAPKEPLDICILYGWHPVMEALRNPRRKFLRFLASENALRKMQDGVQDGGQAEGQEDEKENLSEKRDLASEQDVKDSPVGKTPFTLPIEPEIVHPREIDRLLTPDAVHQGLYLEVKPLPQLKFENLPREAVLLVFDQITDPHNVGAMLRTAAAFGVSAVITTARHSPSATGVLAKSASGALEHVPIIEVRNLSDALEDLKTRGYLCVGLDSEGGVPLDSPQLPIALRTPLALVMGAEGKGLRQRTRETCHFMASLPMPGIIKSLNVSNATALSLYIATRAIKTVK
jgi:23S rRNA (guanosine2251-2'-O)-methyltransferase